MNTLADLLAQAQPREEEKRFVDKSMQISDLICSAMNRKGLNQCDLANLLSKKESEVSRWLSGLHNFTLKTLTRIEAVLEEDLVLVFRDGQLPAALKPERASKAVDMADRWAPAPFQTVTVNRHKSANAAMATNLPEFSLSAA